MKKTRIGAIIGIGGSDYDGWTSLNKPMVEIFMQHTWKVVDKIHHWKRKPPWKLQKGF